ncbi:hypothetical protein GCM10010353_45560 [Streptomyces chryseus]|nr:hypothetical protein GCM10010353_45560 [Streptomyces chryseus]
MRSIVAAECPVEVGRLSGDADGLLVLAGIDERRAEQEEGLSFTGAVCGLPAGGEVLPGYREGQVLLPGVRRPMTRWNSAWTSAVRAPAALNAAAAPRPAATAFSKRFVFRSASRRLYSAEPAALRSTTRSDG